jgi:hypothetical protein
VYKRGLQTQSPLCIQDPFELNHNVARNVDSATIGRIRKLCSEAVGVCAHFQNPKKNRRTNLLHLLEIKIKVFNPIPKHCYSSCVECHVSYPPWVSLWIRSAKVRIFADSVSDLCLIVITLKMQFFYISFLFSHNSPLGFGETKHCSA